MMMKHTSHVSCGWAWMAMVGCVALCGCNDEASERQDASGAATGPSETEVRAPPADDARDGAPAAPPERRGWWELGMPDPFLDELVLYYLGGASYGASEVAEVLETASRVADAEPATWVRAWLQTAERLARMAEASDARGHRLTAGHAYYRSSTYLRAAMHYHPDPHDPELRALALRAVERFTRFLERVHPESASVIQVPYEGTTLTGYWFSGARAGEKAPTIIAHSGRDAWAEDLLYLARAGLERGYNTLLIDGPGQGKTIRINGLPFRPDWEAFITPVIDHLLGAHPEVDPDAIVLMGASMGGYLAPRAATREPRIRLLVANPGVVSWHQAILATLASYLPDVASWLAQGDEAFDHTIEALFSHSPFLAWGFADMAWHHGVTRPSELMRDLARYTFEGHEREIRAHTLVIDAEDEGPRGQARLLYERLDPARRDLIVFTREEAAQFHVQPGATAVLTHKVFDWIDAELGR